jgi:hypothetical protein
MLARGDEAVSFAADLRFFDIRTGEPETTYPDISFVSEKIQGAPTDVSSKFSDYYRRIAAL